MADKIKNFTNSNVKYLRIKKNISQQKMAKDLHINQATLAKWESNTRKITLEYAIILSNYFNIPVGDFISKNLIIEEENTK